MLLALPSASRERRRQLAEAGVNLGVQVLTVPTLAEIQDGSARVDQIRPVSIDELLGRTPVAPKTELLQRLVVARNVLVSGAGGSIGSELCRKILACRPDRLVLLDACEHNLYSIEMELRNWMSANRSDVRLEAVLGSVQDAVLVERLLQSNRIQTVYHAAAYKHVPIVERHESVGAETNVIGTHVLAVAAQRAGVETFVLVSTDKAVRPTSVMGASKRVAEMVLQGLHDAGSRTRFCMVRFGNVLGSSGSVIPLFREQIARGGPLTVTHPDMVRYFMTIPEAADLILQAGAMAKGGEVFLLDMGEPVRVDDLARNMIRLAGRSVRDAAHPAGDIEIQYTGIRPGEKMFEELLIGDVAQPTEHVSIRLGHEPALPSSLMSMHLDRLRAAIDQRDDALVRSLLHDMVREASGSAATAR
jgi:FlaA1/EpsC-like NDP-sugar epimerase